MCNQIRVSCDRANKNLALFQSDNYQLMLVQGFPIFTHNKAKTKAKPQLKNIIYRMP